MSEMKFTSALCLNWKNTLAMLTASAMVLCAIVTTC